MAQIGNNEKPMKLTPNRIGKGSRPRPIEVSRAQFENNCDKIFKSKQEK